MTGFQRSGCIRPLRAEENCEQHQEASLLLAPWEWIPVDRQTPGPALHSGCLRKTHCQSALRDPRHSGCTTAQFNRLLSPLLLHLLLPLSLPHSDTLCTKYNIFKVTSTAIGQLGRDTLTQKHTSERQSYQDGGKNSSLLQ